MDAASWNRFGGKKHNVYFPIVWWSPHRNVVSTLRRLDRFTYIPWSLESAMLPSIDTTMVGVIQDLLETR